MTFKLLGGGLPAVAEIGTMTRGLGMPLVPVDTFVPGDGSGHVIAFNGTPLPNVPILDFAGDGVSVDNVGASSVVTIPSSVPAHVIAWEEVTLAHQPILKFEGAVSVANAGGATVVTIPGADVRPDVATIAGTTHQLTAANENTLLLFTDASNISVTAPSDTTEDLPIGYITHLHQEGLGQITVVADGGVALRFSDSAKTRVQYSSISVMKISSNTYKIVGDQEPA